MSNCPFCGIVAGSAPAHRLYEDDRTLAFLDIAPVNPGHALVVPKVHRETLTEMSPTSQAPPSGAPGRWPAPSGRRSTPTD